THAIRRSEEAASCYPNGRTPLSVRERRALAIAGRATVTAVGEKSFFCSLERDPQISVGTLLLWKLSSCDRLPIELSSRLSRRRRTALIRSIVNQRLERLRGGKRLIRPQTRAGKRVHAANRREALGLGLEHHQVERLLAMAARAASHQEGRGDALELTGRNISARVGLHALDGALNLCRLHRDGYPKTPVAVTLHAILGKDLANSQGT